MSRWNAIRDESRDDYSRTISTVPAASRAMPSIFSQVIALLVEPEHAEPVEHDRERQLARR